MQILTEQAGRRKPNPVDFDLSAARQYLRRLANAVTEAAFSSDPRVVHLGVQLACDSRERRTDDGD
jgi:hypothetical protein